MRAHRMRSTEAATTFCMVIKLDVRKLFNGRPSLLPWPIFLVTRMLTRDLFAVANRLVYLR